MLSGCAATDAPETSATLCPAAVVLSSRTPIIAATATSAEHRPSLPASVLAALRREGDSSDSACVALLSPGGQLTALPLTPHRSNGEVEQGSRRGELLDADVQAVNTAVGRLAATTPGLDLRGLISAAAAAHPAPTRLYLISSGISTVDPIDLRVIGWTDGHVLGAWLTANDWLRPMPGWILDFLSLGSAGGSQPQISDPLRERLIAMWVGVCQELGAARCDAGREPTSTDPPISTDSVPPITPPAPRQFASSVQLPEPALFAIGSAVLQPDADGDLRLIVQAALARDLTLEVLGHTDAVTGTPASNLQLSQRRAEAVRQRLIALGLPAARITSTAGVGSGASDAQAELHDPGRIDRDRNVEVRWSTGASR